MPPEPGSQRPYEESARTGAGGPGTAAAPIPKPPLLGTGGGNAGVPSPAVNAEAEARIRELYPHLALYLDHPELGPLLRQAAEAGWSPEQLQGAVWQTEWWRSTSAAARTWDNLGLQDPAEAQRQRDVRRGDVEAEIGRLGLAFEPLDVNHVVETSLRLGMGAGEITRFIISMASTRGFRVSAMGTVQSDANQIMALAKQYLMPLTPAQARDYAMRVASGSLSMDGLTAFFADTARARFVNDRQMIANLDRGLTVADVLGPVIGTVASELGLDPNAIDPTHPRFSVLLESRQADGSVRSMTPTEARIWARTQPEWDRSEGARSEGTQLATALLDFMGVR